MPIVNQVGKISTVAGVLIVAGVVFAMTYLDGPVRSARSLEQQNKYEEAAEQYVYATTGPIYKNNAGIYYEVAHCARLAGDYDLAMEYADKGLKICKEHPYLTSFLQCCGPGSTENRLQTVKGWILYNKEEYENAKSTFDEVLKTYKDYFAYAGRAAVFEAQKMYKEAEADFAKAIETATSSTTREEAYHERARYYRNTDRPDEAIKDLTAALNQSSCDMAYYDRALQYQKVGELNKAIEDLDKAIGMNNNKEDYYHSRANIHIELREFNQAKNDIDAAMSLNSNCQSLNEDKARVEAVLKNQ